MRFVPVATFFALLFLFLCPITWVGMERGFCAQTQTVAQRETKETTVASKPTAPAQSNELMESDEATEAASEAKAARQRAALAAKRQMVKTGKTERTAKTEKTRDIEETKDGANPPSAKTVETPLVRKNGKEEASKDSQPGFLTLSDGTTIAGTFFLTRDRRVKIEDKAAERQREIPLSAIVSIETLVDREWMEDEWRFRENANNEKYYTGRSYPSRVYHHRVTLRDGRKIEGSLSEVVYVDPAPELIYPEMSPSEIATKGLTISTRRFLLHKRDKGELGETLKELSYVKLIRLGEDTLEEGLAKAKKSPIREKSTRKETASPEPTTHEVPAERSDRLKSNL